MTQDHEKRPAFLVPLAGLVAVTALALFVIFRFAANQAEADLASWQSRMNLIADSRRSEVSEWLNRHLNSVELIAGDASVQLYASTIVATEDDVSAEAQRGFIYSLLSAEAETTGFHEQRAIDTVAANVKRPRRAGLALTDGAGRVLVASPGMPMLRPTEILPGTDRAFIKLGPALDDKTPLVLIGAPVVGNGGAGATAWIVGARPLDSDFLSTLEQPGDDSATAETYLVTAGADGVVTPITPTALGGRIGEARLDEAASFAARQPGGFSEQENYAGRHVLVTGRELSAPVPWILVRTIEASEAFADINERRNSLFITLSLAALSILVAMVLIWRHGVSRKLEKSYAEQAALSDANASLSRFLQAVSDSQPAAIAALDADMTARFVNEQMGEVAGLPTKELKDRRLDTVFESNVAGLLRDKVAAAADGTPQTIDTLRPSQRSGQVYKTEILPLDAGGDQSAAALLVMQDITDLIAANARSEALFRQLIGTLTQIIDARDPWSKHHSARVADVARAIAAEMGWDDTKQEAMEIAGQLVNLGKIFVPIDILTKQSPLTEAELALVRDSMSKGAGLIKDVAFSGQVAETLEQMREHWDGSGEPQGLKAEEIEPGARVLSVANAFVGIVSARAHRESLGFDKAIDILQSDAGKRYERRAVAALQNILENKEGRQMWAEFTERAADD